MCKYKHLIFEYFVYVSMSTHVPNVFISRFNKWHPHAIR